MRRAGRIRVLVGIEGVATAATYNTTPQKAVVNAARSGRNHRPNYRHRFMPGQFGHD